MKNKISGQKNRYYTPHSPKIAFTRVRGIQNTSLRLLFSKRLIDPDWFERGYCIPVPNKLPESLDKIIQQENDRDAEIMDFLVAHVAEIDFLGQNGLKHRTGLMEFRYDAV
jgi:hypothetical protein